MQLRAAHRHLNDSLGLPGQAQDYAREAEAFAKLTAFPASSAWR
jgi:hypothetical protein